ncbi:MAG: hypothetical protein ABR538_10975 [Candidatus Binatia bacterium]
MGKKRRGTCVLCCERPATTGDHLPPENIFADPKPANLITVPACGECNNGAKLDDERFRNFVALQVGDRTETGRRLWRQTAARGISTNLAFMREVILPSEPVWISTKSGIITGRGWRVEFDMAVVARVVHRMVRGLYYRHHREPLPVDVDISIALHRGPAGPGLAETVRGWPGRNMDDQFVYLFNHLEGDPRLSMWILGFHQSLWVRAFTGEEAMRGLESQLSPDA